VIGVKQLRHGSMAGVDSVLDYLVDGDPQPPRPLQPCAPPDASRFNR
jgi:hypothetical protein